MHWRCRSSAPIPPCMLHWRRVPVLLRWLGVELADEQPVWVSYPKRTSLATACRISLHGLLKLARANYKQKEIRARPTPAPPAGRLLLHASMCLRTCGTRRVRALVRAHTRTRTGACPPTCRRARACAYKIAPPPTHAYAHARAHTCACKLHRRCE